MEYIKQNNLKHLKKIINKDCYDKILVVTGKNSFSKSGAKKIITNLLINKKKKIFFRSSKLPEIEELKNLNNEIKIFKPKLIISIGGGATLDLAKVANVLYDEKNLESKIKNNKYSISDRFCDLLAIPTTAGSGAEVTTNAVIYVGKRKFSIESKFVKPNYSLLFPELIISNTFNTKVSSAFDALSQAIESMISVNSNPKSLQYSIKSIKYFLNNYTSYIYMNKITYTYNICLSAYYSGKAISITKTTAPHAISYPFTSYFNVPHGHAVSLTLSEFLKFNFKNHKKSLTKFNLINRYNILFKLFNVHNISELITKIENIKNTFGLETDLIKINKNIPKKINLILNNVNVQRLTNNPVRVTKKNILDILNKKIKESKY